MEVFLWWIIETKVPNMISTHLNISLIFFVFFTDLCQVVQIAICIITYWFCIGVGDFAEPSLRRVGLRWDVENWVGWVRAWICGKIWKEKLYIMSFVHLSHPAFSGRLNIMKSLSRTTVNMGENALWRAYANGGGTVSPSISQMTLRMELRSLNMPQPP